jgi:hypothetical protein
MITFLNFFILSFYDTSLNNDNLRLRYTCNVGVAISLIRIDAITAVYLMFFHPFISETKIVFIHVFARFLFLFLTKRTV